MAPDRRETLDFVLAFNAFQDGLRTAGKGGDCLDLIRQSEGLLALLWAEMEAIRQGLGDTIGDHELEGFQKAEASLARLVFLAMQMADLNGWRLAEGVTELAFLKNRVRVGKNETDRL